MQTLAYLDAGTGSMLVQAIAAGAAGAAVVAKVGWHRVTGTFRRKPDDRAEETAAATDDAEKVD